ncbi:potassium transporter KefB [Roseivirga sp.]|uniref:potassium transporter KefB n=1 Tax=Roseivirga sp. TaxID=1964215 RepID=UPI003B51ADCF
MTGQATPENSIQWPRLRSSLLTGAVIGLTLISLFIVSAGNADPSWARYWFVKPLIITPTATAMGGAFYYFIDHTFEKNGWNKALAFIIGIVGFTVSLWLGTVLGMNGTYWN